ncbi:hypothetical protein [Actinosynnema sp. NPDC023587]|uniref:hypothetical protein n=1 Tax=Actinosynnema sp. NPDC023587 TaxID=3154695 RepID=UPI003403E784
MPLTRRRLTTSLKVLVLFGALMAGSPPTADAVIDPHAQPPTAGPRSTRDTGDRPGPGVVTQAADILHHGVKSVAGPGDRRLGFEPDAPTTGGPS